MISLYLTVPKFIVLKSTRLAVFSICVRLAISSLLVAYFFTSRQFVGEVSIGQGMDVSMWVTHHASPEMLEQIWVDAARSPLCKTPSIYDYWWGENYKYETQGCTKLCGDKSDTVEASPSCIDDGLYVRENHDQLFFITRQELSSRSKLVNSSATFFPQVVALGLGLNFNYNVHVPQFDFPWLFGQKGHDHVGSSQRNVFTAVLDSQGRVNKTMEPTTSIEFSVPDLLWLAGNIEFLDTPDTIKSVNQKPNATSQHPTGRVSGGMLTIKIHCSDKPDCHNCEDEKQQLFKAWSSGAYDTMCVLRVVLGYDQWAYHETTINDSEGNTMLLARQGLRVTCKRDGAFEYWEGSRIFLLVTSWIVWVGFAEKIVLMFIITGLGLMSTIYKRAIYDQFDIRETVAGMATRLTVASVIFDLLQDKRQQGITEGCVKNQVQRVFEQRYSQIDEREQHIFAEFCWEAQKLQNFEPHSSDPVRDSTSYTSTYKSPADSKPLNIDSFSIAFSNFERLEFNSLVKLFDKDRAKGSLEIFFTPKYLSKAIKRAQLCARHGTDPQEVAERSSSTASTSGRIQQESQDNQEENNENPPQSGSRQFRGRYKTFGEEAIWKAQAALAEVATLRKTMDSRFRVLELACGHQLESRLAALETKLDKVGAKQDHIWAKLEMTDNPRDNLLSDIQKRLVRLENLGSAQRFEQLEERFTEFEHLVKHEKIPKRIGRLEDFVKRAGKERQPLLYQDAAFDVGLEKGSAASALDQQDKEIIQESFTEFQGWVVKKIADCIDDGRTSFEGLEKRMQHLAGTVARLEERVFTVENSEENLVSNLRGLPSDNNDEIDFSGKTVAHDDKHEDGNASISLEVRSI